MAKKNALGKGLSALLESASTDITSRYANDENPKTVNSTSLIPIKQIETNPFQPRTTFDEEALQELTNSIETLGIIQPITVRKLGYDKFQIISGERRFRASQRAGLTEIPAYIRIANDQAMLEMAIVENVQRDDLDAIEVALSYQRLLDECKLTQEKLSERVGKKRATVANYLRLLKLPEEVQAAIITRKISMGHARALLGSEDKTQQLEILDRILSEGLSVRAVERLVKGEELEVPSKVSAEEKSSSTPSEPAILPVEYAQIRDEISENLGMKVQLKRSEKGNGKIEISFNSDIELKEFLNRING
jgi:ParB family chromosome partitioning protein